MPDEKIDLSKFDIKSLVVGKKEDIWKSLRYGIIFSLILGLGYIIYRGADALFPKPKPSVQTIKVEKGGQATIIQQTEKKRLFIPFVEPFVGIGTNTKGEGRAEVGGRLGCRIEF